VILLTLLMLGLHHRRRCFCPYFLTIFCAWMTVYDASPEAVWSLRPRGNPPPCSPELRARLQSVDLWAPTRLVCTTSGWRPLPRRGCRAGRRVYQQTVTSSATCCACPDSPEELKPKPIPVLVGHQTASRRVPREYQPRVLVDVLRRTQHATRGTNSDYSPTLYVLNAAAITKLHAVEHLAADLLGYKVDVAVI